MNILRLFDVVILLSLMNRNFYVTCVYTKPYKFLGLPSGQILQCEMDKLDACSVFAEVNSAVYSLSFDGEYLFGGLADGRMIRCEIKTQACDMLNNAGNGLTAVFANGVHIIAGTIAGTLWRCGMLKPHSCADIDKTDVPIKSIAISGEYIYAGLSTGIMWRCRLGLSNSCLTFNQATSSVNALTIYGKYVYAGLESGTLWMCSLFTENSCEIIYTADNGITAIDIFERNFHLALNNGVILRCGIINRDCWVLTDRKSKVLSLANVYATTTLRTPFIGENWRCQWQDQTLCPPYVMYYNIEDRSFLELQIKNRRIYSKNGKIYDTTNADKSYTGNKAIFVMEPGGRIYASKLHPLYLIHHSSLVAGSPVAAAGEIVIENGIIKSVNNCAGQYRSTIEMTQQIKTSLEMRGYERNISIIDCKDLTVDLVKDMNVIDD